TRLQSISLPNENRSLFRRPEHPNPKIDQRLRMRLRSYPPPRNHTMAASNLTQQWHRDAGLGSDPANATPGIELG
ncbi:unnamed protein product, partial [Linum tenue]